jgi:tetratricopeptide (TPR) repeat protein
MRPYPYCAAVAAPDDRFVSCVLLTALMLTSISGCAIFGRHSPSAESVATARELSRQGVASLEMGQPQQAEDLLNKALATSPNDASTRRYLAEALWRRNARPEALAQMTEAIRLESANAGLAERAGEMSLASGRYDLGLDYAERAIRLDPKLAGAWALRGRCFQQMNQPDRALADLERSLELAPNSSDVLMDVASIYHQRGQSARCLTAIYHLVDSYTPGEEPQSVLVMQGLTLLDLGRARQANDVLLAALKHGPPSADLYFYVAQSYSAAGQTTEASAAARQALAINGAHAPSQQLLAQLASRGASEAPQRR